MGYVSNIVMGKVEHRILLSYRQTEIIYSVHSDYIYIHLLWNTSRNPEDLSKELNERNDIKVTK